MKKVIIFAPFVCAALYSILAFLTPVVPFAGLLCALLLILTGVFSLFRNSRISLGCCSIIVVVVTYLVNKEIVYSLLYSLSYIAAGFFLCYSLLRRKGGTYAVIVTMICIIMADYGSVAISNLFYGKPPFVFIDEIFDMIRPIFLETVGQNAELFKIEDPEQFFNLYEMSVKMILPAVIIIIELLKTILLAFLTKVLVNKVVGGIAVDLRFSMFKADGVTVFVFFLSAIIGMFAGDSVIAVVFGNIYSILSTFLILCGMSLLDWYLRDIRKVRIFFRFLILSFLGVLSLFPLFSVILIVAALVDSRRNFRGVGEITQDK